jgi:hypothetical protein
MVKLFHKKRTSPMGNRRRNRQIPSALNKKMVIKYNYREEPSKISNQGNRRKCSGFVTFPTNSDPDLQIRTMEFRIRIWLRILLF